MQLTKDADKLICSMYKSYLEKRKLGMSKLNARHFEPAEINSYKLCNDWSLPDIKETVAELSRAGLGTMYFNGGFMANDQFIIYMENRFKNGFLEVTDFISKFIPYVIDFWSLVLYIWSSDIISDQFPSSKSK